MPDTKAQQGETRCMMCGNRREGLDVRPDFVIDAIRWFKRNVTRNEKGYLVVCKECYPQYAKSRKKFENRQILYMALGIIFAALIFITSVNKALAVLYAIAILVFVYLLSLLTYIPALDMPQNREKGPKGGKSGRGK
jgi:hypothetical protein